MKQKKISYVVLTLMTLSILLSSCSKSTKQSSWLEFFQLKSVKSVKSKLSENDVEELKKKISGHERIINKKIKAADKLGDLYEALGTKYLFRQNWRLAIESFEQAVSHGNTSDKTHRRLASAYANLARELDSDTAYERALYHYRLALDKNPDNRDAHYGIALILFYARSRQEEALSIVKELLQREPDFYQARFAHARMIYEMGDPNTSLSLYQAILDDLKYDNSNESRALADDARKNISRLTAELAGAAN